jgi:hypothetical protein
MTTPITDAVNAAWSVGISVLPPKENGTKRPDVPRWKQYIERLPTKEELQGWYQDTDRQGVGVVCGGVSGGLEMLEFEGRAVAAGVFDIFRQRCEAAGLGDLFAQVEYGYRERTPSGGVHLFYRCPTPLENTKLAKRADKAVLIETRGEGGYCVTAPSNSSCHPTGKPWVLEFGGWRTVATITDEQRDALFDIARTFDETAPREAPPAAPPLDGDRSRRWRGACASYGRVAGRSSAAGSRGGVMGLVGGRLHRLAFIEDEAAHCLTIQFIADVGGQALVSALTGEHPVDPCEDRLARDGERVEDAARPGTPVVRDAEVSGLDPAKVELHATSHAEGGGHLVVPGETGVVELEPSTRAAVAARWRWFTLVGLDDAAGDQRALRCNPDRRACQQADGEDGAEAELGRSHRTPLLVSRPGSPVARRVPGGHGVERASEPPAAAIVRLASTVGALT